jgi:hypothetical protein
MVSLIDEAWRLEPFVPPFQFSAFFSPEDTLLCVCAAEAARRQLLAGVGESSEERLRITELTAGSGLIGLRLLRDDSRVTLLGLDIDKGAAAVAERNARVLGLSDRSRFAQSDLWSAETLDLLRMEKPHLLVCNPPYVPEPPETCMQIEAGAGPHGTAHLLRALALTRIVQPNALALSWCSLSDPAAVVACAEDSGYELHDLFVTAIADGEYSGSVHWYLRDLENCYINEQTDTLATVAPDGAARFAYLLFAGAFVGGRREAGSGKRDAVSLVTRLCESFAGEGISALAAKLDRYNSLMVHPYVLNRWDELQLRVMLHGEVAPRAATQ